MVAIPKTQTAVIFEKANGPLFVRNNHPVVQQPQLKPGEALVRIEYTGVCHTDLRKSVPAVSNLPPHY